MLATTAASAVHPGRLKTRRGPLERLSRSRVIKHATTSFFQSLLSCRVRVSKPHCGACNVLRRLPPSTNARLTPKFQERLDNRCTRPRSSSSHSLIQHNTPIFSFNCPDTSTCFQSSEQNRNHGCAGARDAFRRRERANNQIPEGQSILKELR
jgi:hypothetical protein